MFYDFSLLFFKFSFKNVYNRTNIIHNFDTFMHFENIIVDFLSVMRYWNSYYSFIECLSLFLTDLRFVPTFHCYGIVKSQLILFLIRHPYAPQ